MNTSGVPQPVGNYSFDNIRNASNTLVTSGTLPDGYTVVNGGTGGTAMNGTVNNSENLIGPGTQSITIVPGKFGNAISFDGLGSSVDINSQIVDQSGGNVSTMNIWLNADPTAGAGGAFVGKDAGPDTWAAGHTAYYLGAPTRPNPGTLPTGVRFAGGFEQGTLSVADNTWHMVTFVDTGSGKQIYVDGVPVIDPTQTGADGTDTSTFTRLGFNVDTLSNLDGNTNFDGSMDQIEVLQHRFDADADWAVVYGQCGYDGQCGRPVHPGSECGECNGQRSGAGFERCESDNRFAGGCFGQRAGFGQRHLDHRWKQQFHDVCRQCQWQWRDHQDRHGHDDPFWYEQLSRDPVPCREGLSS